MNYIVKQSRSVAKLQELFHGLIRSRARDGNIEIPCQLPNIALENGTEEEPAWFPVPGMFGGFAFWVEWRNEEPILHSQSWCRIVEGSGQRHVVTPNEVRLIDEGFV